MLTKLTLIIFLFLVISFFVFAPLYQAKATDWFYALKEYGLDLLARFISKTIYAFMSDNIVGRLLLSGRDGGPAFIENWRDFTQLSQYRGEDIFRATISNITLGGGATACSHIRSPLSLIFNAKSPVTGFIPDNFRVNSLQPFKLKNDCTLPSNLNVAAFTRDFTQGGWPAWNELIKPQNNFSGVFTNSIIELDNQRSFEENLDRTEAISGSGFTGKQSPCKGTGQNKQCLIFGQVVTPGKLFSDSAAATIDRELDWLISSDEISETLIDATAYVQQKLVNYVDSLPLRVKNSLIPPSKNRSIVDDGTGTSSPDGSGTPTFFDNPNIGNIQDSAVQVCISNCQNTCPKIDVCTPDPTTGTPLCSQQPDPVCTSGCSDKCQAPSLSF